MTWDGGARSPHDGHGFWGGWGFEDSEFSQDTAWSTTQIKAHIVGRHELRMGVSREWDGGQRDRCNGFGFAPMAHLWWVQDFISRRGRILPRE